MFCVGDKIVHPMHGAGVIESIVDEKIGRDLVRFYVFRMPVSGLTLKIPTANSEMIGVRAVSSAETIERVLAELTRVTDGRVESLKEEERFAPWEEDTP